MKEPVREISRLRILVVDPQERSRAALTLALKADDQLAESAASLDEALTLTAQQAFDLIFLDILLSSSSGMDHIQMLMADNPWTRIVILTSDAISEKTLDALKRGAADFLLTPFDPPQLRRLIQQLSHRRALERKMDSLQTAMKALDPEADFQSQSPLYCQATELARRAATAAAPVLIHGEPGTGRGKLARDIHTWSSRANGPFAAVRFAGRTVDEIDVELFGLHTQPPTQTGAVAFCHGGTLFVEEVSELPLHLQPKLLELIREKEFERRDDYVRRRVDVRILATTSVDLEQLVSAGTFRQDLLMALNITQVRLPALRQRPQDIAPLAQCYLQYFSAEHHRPIAGFDRDALYLLTRHPWPGNLRELRNVVERAVLHCTQDRLGLKHLPSDLANTNTGNEKSSAGHQVGDLVPLRVIEESHINRVIASVKTLRRAAAVLEMNYSALCRRMRRGQAQNSRLKTTDGKVVG